MVHAKRRSFERTGIDMSEPIHIISLGAGVQSSTMALMAAKGEIAPMPVCAIFADTQDEPQSVYTWLDWLEKQLPFPVHRVTKGKLSDHALTGGVRADGNPWLNMSIPAFVKLKDGSVGPLGRGCTRDFKIKPILKKIRLIADVPRGCKRVMVKQWIGISLDEVSRMKPSREPWIENQWPLIDARMNRGDCLRWMQERGLPQPPRSACGYCPYHSDSEWARIKKTEPGAFSNAVVFEKKMHALNHLRGEGLGLPFLHRSCVPLETVDFSTEEERGQTNMFNNECEGMCGV